MTTLTTATIGQTEKALTALLADILRDTGLAERHWITLKLTALGTPSGEEEAPFTARLAGVLKVPPYAAAVAIAELAALGLLAVDDRVTLTPAGRARYEGIAAEVASATGPIFADLPAEDAAAAARVLGEILRRTNAQLAGRAH